MSSRKKSKKKNAPPATAPVAAALAPWERRSLCAIVLLGLLLRWAGMSGLAVEHFDEGVYASNLYCGHLDPPYAYPMRHLYAPPLFPALLEWAQVFWKAEATMWVNVLLGGLTVVAVWYATRCWFGRSAALAAAILAATGEYHIAFSRMALTDVPLSLFLLAGVFAGGRAILSGRPAWVVAGGVLAGLAWCTKYNGWLTLAITGSGTLAWFFARVFVPKFLHRGDEKGTAAADNSQISNLKSEISNRKNHVAGSAADAASADCRLGSAVARWTVTAAIAGAIFWVFVVRELAPLGGYAAVAKNHAGYFVGLAGWWPGFLRQGAAHDLVTGWPTCIGVAAAWWMCGVIGLRAGGDGTGLRRWILMGLIGLAAALAARLLTASGLLAIAALIGFVCVQRSNVVRDEVASGSDPAAANLAAWLLCAWFCGLLVSVPLYYPYPRLSVPWVVVCWPLAGAAIAALTNPKSQIRNPKLDGRTSSDSVPPEGGTSTGNPKSKIQNPKSLVTAAAAVVAMIGLTIALGRVSAPLRAWRSRVLIEDIAQRMLQEIESAAADTGTESGSGIAAIVYVAGDPAAFYQLSAACSNPRIAFQPIAEAEGLRATADVPTFLVSRETANSPNRDVPGLRMIASNRFQPSDMVLLDRMPAADVRRQGGLPTDQLRLYRIGREDSGFGIQDSEKAVP